MLVELRRQLHYHQSEATKLLIEIGKLEKNMAQPKTYTTGQPAQPKNDIRPIVWAVGQLWDTGNLLWRVVDVDNGVAIIHQVDRKRRDPVSSRDYRQATIPHGWTFVGMHRRDSLPVAARWRH